MREELTLREGLIFYQGTEFVSEQGKRKEILEAGHGLHIGRTRIKKRIQEVFWWPGPALKLDIFLKDCMECEMSDRIQKTWSTPSSFRTTPSETMGQGRHSN